MLLWLIWGQMNVRLVRSRFVTLRLFLLLELKEKSHTQVKIC